jgi:hypothetical protein
MLTDRQAEKDELSGGARATPALIPGRCESIELRCAIASENLENPRCAIAHLWSGPEPVIGPRFARIRWDHPGMTNFPYAIFSNSSRPISMRRISLVPAPIS